MGSASVRSVKRRLRAAEHVSAVSESCSVDLTYILYLRPPPPSPFIGPSEPPCSVGRVLATRTVRRQPPGRVLLHLYICALDTCTHVYVPPTYLCLHARVLLL